MGKERKTVIFFSAARPISEFCCHQHFLFAFSHYGNTNFSSKVLLYYVNVAIVYVKMNTMNDTSFLEQLSKGI